jgi:hypothetical protein
LTRRKKIRHGGGAKNLRKIMNKSTSAAFVCVLMLSACAGRDPYLPTVALASDQTHDCNVLESEIIANANTARSKIASNNSRDNGDVAIGIGGALLFWPALFAIDTKNADGHEGNALIDRNEHLKQIAIKKNCDVTAYPTVVKYQ